MQPVKTQTWTNGRGKHKRAGRSVATKNSSSNTYSALYETDPNSSTNFDLQTKVSLA